MLSAVCFRFCFKPYPKPRQRLKTAPDGVPSLRPGRADPPDLLPFRLPEDRAGNLLFEPACCAVDLMDVDHRRFNGRVP